MQSGRGQSPDYFVLEEAGYMNPLTVASTMAYFARSGVGMTALSSTKEKNHWLMQAAELPEVRKIVQTMACETCAKSQTTICIHKFHLRPRHIDVHSGKRGVLQKMMELVMEGFYGREILGIPTSLVDESRRVLSSVLVEKLLFRDRVALTGDIVADVHSIAVIVDPVLASGTSSGMGLCVLLRTDNGNIYVSIVFYFLIFLIFFFFISLMGATIATVHGHFLGEVAEERFGGEKIVVPFAGIHPRSHSKERIAIAGAGVGAGAGAGSEDAVGYAAHATSDGSAGRIQQSVRVGLCR